jgi:Acyl-CoA dehydrogenases
MTKDDRNLFIETLRKFVATEVTSNIIKRYEASHGETWPRDLVRKLFELGVVTMRFPESYGGIEASLWDAALAQFIVSDG